MSSRHRTVETQFLLTAAFLAVFSSFIFLTRYATVDDFVFQNLSGAMYVERTGHLHANNDSFPGYSAMCVIFSNVLGIRYESVVALPFLTPLFFFVLVAVLRRISTSPSNIALFLILGSCVLYFGLNPTLFCHTVGLALCFVVVLASLLRMERYETVNKKKISTVQSSIVLLILITSINMISYKMMLFTILFLLGLLVYLRFESVQNHRKTNDRPGGFKYPATIGFVIALSFNWFFYKEFIPSIQDSSERPLYGILRLLSALTSGETTALSEYAAVGETSKLPLYLAWALLILLSIILCYGVYFRRTLHGIQTSNGTRTVVAFISAGIVILMIYSALGIADLTYVLIGGLLGYSVLLGPNQRDRRQKLRSKSVTAVISIMFLISVSMNAYAVIDNSYGGQTDHDDFQYLEDPAVWYMTHASENASTSTDVLTWGYLVKQARLSGELESHDPHPFSKDDLFLILEPQTYPSNPDEKRTISLASQYIFNYRGTYFAVTFGWERFNSWSHYREEIYSNPHLNVIYASGSIDICRAWG